MSNRVVIRLVREGENIVLGVFTTKQVDVGQSDLFPSTFGVSTFKHETKFLKLLSGDKLTLDII